MNESGKGQMAAYVAAALLLLVGGAYLLRGEGGSDSAAAGGGVAMAGAGGGAAPGESAGAGAPPGAAASAGAAAGRPVFVHVAGAVRRPGIYRVRSGARVATAVKKAGGLTRRADLTAFNLATTLRDTQQVVVPRRGEAEAKAAMAATSGASPGGAAAPGGAPGQPISLSSATPEQLDGLDGIGPKLSQAIIGYRNQHKGFRSVAELKEVDGIGEKRFATLSRAVRP